jgi:Ca2+-binding RTX toxin-like protein
VYYYDKNFKPLVDWYDANIFVSYRDLISGSSSWIFDGFNGADTIIGNKYNDIIKSGDLNDVLKGKAGNDRLYGEFGNDKLFGDAGNDRLFGQQGNDDLYGGIGKDHYKGGRGNDDFIFKSISDAGRGGKCDVIDDFDLRRDYVVLSAIDADITHAGNQAFEFIGKSGFSGDAGELRCRGGIVSGDVNGDASADFHIDVGLQMREIDFVL